MMPRLTRERANITKTPISQGGEDSSGGPDPLLAALGSRRWTVFLVTLVCMAGAVLYIRTATPVFTSTATITIEQTGTKILTDAGGVASHSETFLWTQAEILKSTPILSAASEQAHFRDMKTFARIEDPIAWLQMEPSLVFQTLVIEVGKRTDLLAISVDSPYADEAAAIANAIVDTYISQQSRRKKATGSGMLKVLQNEKEERETQAEAQMTAMLEFANSHAILSASGEKGNPVLDRLSFLCTSLAAAELETHKLATALETAKAIQDDPILLRQYIVATESKGNNAGDLELAKLRGELQRFQLNLATMQQVNGSASKSVGILRADIASLSKEIERKEKEIVEAQVTSISQDLADSKTKQQQIRAAFLEQEKQAKALNADVSEYSRLDAEVQRTRKQCELLDARIMQVTVDSEEAGALSVRLVEPARAGLKPNKPRKTLLLIAGLIGGLALGSGLALTGAYLDRRVRTIGQATSAIGMPLVGSVPHVPRWSTHAAFDQHGGTAAMRHVEEAYRMICESIYFNAPANCKTILITSAMPGDGKSTTARNLALAMAQGGHRTLLIDADFHNPTTHAIFDVKNKPGLSDVLAGTAKLRDSVHSYPSSSASFHFLARGLISLNLTDAVIRKRLVSLLEIMGRSYDRIIIDSPPIMTIADAWILAAAADTSLLVVRMNKSVFAANVSAVENLRSVGAHLSGVIMNDVRCRKNAYGYRKGSHMRHGNRLATVNAPDVPKTHGGPPNGNSDRSHGLVVRASVSPPAHGNDHSDVHPG